MHKLLSIQDLSKQDVLHLFDVAQRFIEGENNVFPGFTCAYSFEGNSVRTRSTFLKALAKLQIQGFELPNLLKTREPKQHLAGYLDNWIDLYIIRESNHSILTAFSEASRQPVINAMTDREHPCEALADLFSIQKHFGGLEKLKICLAGPPSSLLYSWVLICELLDLNYVQVIPQEIQKQADLLSQNNIINSLNEGVQGANVILTEGWPENYYDPNYQITPEVLSLAAPDAWLIPCPPFDVKKEVSQQVIDSSWFAGYDQKKYLYPVQAAIIITLLQGESLKAVE